MARSSKAQSLKRAMKEQGRTTTWLADKTGYSRSYVSSVLHDRVAFTEEFQRRALAALRASGTVPVVYKGRTIQVPEDVYRKAADLPLIVIESAYEEAWKRAWLAEHAQSTLAIAADRAWQAASVLDAA